MTPAPTDAGPAAADPDEVATAVRAVPGVADLHRGQFGEVATLLPGRRVDGIRLGRDRTEVALVLDAEADLRTTAGAVRAAVQPIVGTPVFVVVQDVTDAAPHPTPSTKEPS